MKQPPRRVHLPVAFAFAAAFPELDVQHFDADRKSHGKVNVAFGDVMLKALSNEYHANNHKEAERQHFDGRVI
jgi:hypothetical protein